MTKEKDLDSTGKFQTRLFNMFDKQFNLKSIRNKKQGMPRSVPAWRFLR